QLSFDHGFFKSESLQTISDNEYRNTFVSLGNSKEFCVTTIVYVDSSTYTYIHPATELSVLDVNPKHVHRLSNADIRVPGDRDRRKKEVIAALTAQGFIPEMTGKAPRKQTKGGGPEYRKDPDGTYVL